MRNVIAAVHGTLYGLVGILGFILNPSGGLLLGIFAVNPFHHIFHIALGGFGVVSARFNRGRQYCQVAGIVLLALGAGGFLAPALFAFIIADQNASLVTDNLLHLVTGTALAYFGFLPESELAPAPQNRA
jgi:hypothetical protein